MSKDIIIKELNEIEKQWLLQELANMKFSEIVNYNYEKNESMNTVYTYETITIIRRRKKINLRMQEECKKIGKKIIEDAHKVK